jgi:hypothetical protein
VAIPRRRPRTRTGSRASCDALDTIDRSRATRTPSTATRARDDATWAASARRYAPAGRHATPHPTAWADATWRRTATEAARTTARGRTDAAAGPTADPNRSIGARTATDGAASVADRRSGARGPTAGAAQRPAPAPSAPASASRRIGTHQRAGRHVRRAAPRPHR